MARGRIYAGKAVILIEAQDLIDSTLRGVEAKMKQLSNRIGAMGRTALTGGIFSATGQGLLIKRFAQYSDLILELRVKLGFLNDMTVEQEASMAKLEKRIRSLGKSTSYTTQEVAEGAIKLAQAGFASTEIENMLQAVLDLARGTGTDLDNAARVMANTMRTFSLSTEESTEIVSQFVNAARSGTVEIDDLAESLKYASATAVTLGQSLPIVLAYFTMLSEKGMRGSIAGTSLNTALANMSKKMKDIAALTGQQLPLDANGNLLLTTALQQMSEATKDMPSINRLSVFQDLFNLRGSRAVVPLVTNENDIQRLIQLTSQIEMSGDEARKAAVIMDSGLGGSIRRAVSAADDLNISLNKITEGPLINLANAIPPLLNDLSDWISKNQELAIALAALPALMIAGGAAALTLSFALRQVGSVAAGLSGAMKILGPLASGGLAAKSLQVGGKAKDAASGVLFGKMVAPAKKVKAAKPKGTFQPGILTKGLDKIAQYPIGAASAVPGYNKKAQAFNIKRELDTARKVAAINENAAFVVSEQLVFQKQLRAQYAAQVAAAKRATFGLNINTNLIKNIANSMKVEVDAQKKIAALQAQRASVVTESVTIGKFFNKKGLEELRRTESILTQKMMRAAQLGNVGGAAKYGTARKRVQAQIARATQGPKTLPFMSIESLEGAVAARNPSIAGPSQFRKDMMAGALRNRNQLTAERKGIFERMKTLRNRSAVSGATSSRTLRGAAYAASAARGIGKQGLAPRFPVQGMTILPQILKGLGNLGKATKGLATLAMAFGKVSMSIGRFVFSANGLTLILQILLLFGDRIPVVSGVLERLGAAFMGFFKTIGTLATTMQPAFELFRYGFSLLADQGTAGLGIDAIVTSLSGMAQIVGGTLVAAWQKFKMELGYVWDTLKGTISVVWELGKAIFEIVVNTIGNVLGSQLDNMANRFGMIKDMFMGGGGNFGETVEKIALSLSTFVAQLFNWVGFFIMKANNMFLNFIDKLHIALLQAAGTSAKMMGLTDTTGVPIETIRGGMNERNVKFNRDVKANDEAVKNMVNNMQAAFQSDAAREGAVGFKEAFDQINKVGDVMQQYKANLQNQVYNAQQPVPPPTTATAPRQPTAPAAQVQQQAQVLRTVVAALVGSAAGTRGNVVRSVTESELKKQTSLLEEIKNNTGKQANMAFQ